MFLYIVYNYIGLHNGHTILGGDWMSYNLEVDPEDEDVLVPTHQLIEIPGYIPHELMSLSILIEYQIGLPISKETNFNLKNTHTDNNADVDNKLG